MNSLLEFRWQCTSILNSVIRIEKGKIPQELIPVLTGVFEKVFKENNDMKTETRRMLLKSRTECKAKLKKTSNPLWVR